MEKKPSGTIRDAAKLLKPCLLIRLVADNGSQEDQAAEASYDSAPGGLRN